MTTTACVCVSADCVCNYTRSERRIYLRHHTKEEGDVTLESELLKH